jgi:uncharacterized coiled-coil protein SlyX
LCEHIPQCSAATQPLQARIEELEMAILENEKNVLDDNARLTAENSELRKDKERLDWIQGRGDDAKGMLLEVVCEKYTRAWGLGCNEPTAETLRQAIDQARNQ